MKYNEWNDCIASYFFNPDNAGKDIHFYLTKSDLVKLGKKLLPDKTEQEVWTDYIQVIKFGDRNPVGQTPYSIIDQSLNLFAKWDGQSYPLFISYLILFIVPLTESDDGNFNANNYYGRVNDFFNKNGLLTNTSERSIGSANFQRISSLWDSLEEWSIMSKNCELGIFELKKFGNDKWVHVKKPLSQCLFTPKEIRRLPELFMESGLVPGASYSDEQIKKIILAHGKKYLGIKDNVLRLVSDSKNELGHSIIEIAGREYKKWTGESHQLLQTVNDEKIKRNYTVATLLQQFEINYGIETIQFSYRLHSSNDFPEDLEFDNKEIIYEARGWSKTLQLPFKEKFELKDEFNRWIARFPDKDVRLFIGAGTMQLSNQYWIETDTMSKTSQMHLLCRTQLEDSIIAWGQHFRATDFKKLELEGLPKGFALFRIQYPKQNHPAIYMLSIGTEKSIQLNGGLKVAFNTYLNLHLPEVEIINADGNEEVFIVYKDDGIEVPLAKRYTNDNRWQLPENMALESAFNIRIRNQTLRGYDSTWFIVSSDDACLKIDASLLPKRDPYGKVFSGTSKSYAEGSNVFGINWKMQQGCMPDFMPIVDAGPVSKGSQEYANECGNLLLTYLTVKSESSAVDFYEVFERIHGRIFLQNNIQYPVNLSRMKRISLNLFDFLGYVDYDYQLNRIVVNPPQLILIPSKKGRKALLIGGRDPAFLSRLIDAGNKMNVGIDIYQQQDTNAVFLIPDTITISASKPAREGYGEQELKAFCNELKIIFNRNEITQFGLQEFSVDIRQYESYVIANNETTTNDYDWARKIFNPSTLRFEKSTSKEFDTTYTLVEYKLREWEYHHKLWINGRCYNVDKNWTRYMIVKKVGRQVIFFDEQKRTVAIPAALPLPRLFAESIALLSGRAPSNKIMMLEGDQYWYSLFENVPSIFIQNFFMKLGQKVTMKSF